MRGPAIAAIALWLELGCGAGESTARADRRLEDDLAAPAEAPRLRRPAMRWVFVRIGDRCEVRRIEGDERVTKIEDDACPLHLEPGERIRLVGKTCLREGLSAARERPVVCPDSLTNAEMVFREGRQPPR